MDLNAKTAIVTGGASGLGLSVVRLLQEKGAEVVVADVQRGSNDLGGAEFVECDVTSHEAVQKGVDAAVAKGPLWAMICCAGIGTAGKIIGKDGPQRLEDFNKVVAVNLLGSFNALRLAAWAMKDNEPDDDAQRGAIVLTASIAAFEGQVGQVAYSASKGGIVGMVLPAARELARSGIRVAAIAPGIFDTPMLAKVPQGVRQSLAQGVPFPKRLGKPDEFASMVGTILDNTMINGVTLRVDGALRMI